MRLEVGNIESYRLGPFPTYSLRSKAYSLFTGDFTADLHGSGSGYVFLDLPGAN